MIAPLLAGLGPTELLIILVVVVLLFGASKLPDLARGSGQALRIFKSETKGLLDEDDTKESKKPIEQRDVEARDVEARNVEARNVEEKEHRSDPGA